VKRKGFERENINTRNEEKPKRWNIELERE
jgi:hypothetical protein